MLELTDEQLNIAICEARGCSFTRSEMSGGVEEWHDPDGEIIHTLPSHITGIEALGNMHKAEKGLTKKQVGIYHDLLLNETPDARFVSSTARQRAIALLRVVKPELFV